MSEKQKGGSAAYVSWRRGAVGESRSQHPQGQVDQGRSLGLSYEQSNRKPHEHLRQPLAVPALEFEDHSKC